MPSKKIKTTTLNTNALKTLFLWVVLLTVSLPGMASAQNTPPGLLNAPPCMEPDSMPDQAKVPCAAILEFRSSVSRNQRAAKVKKVGAALRYNYHNTSAVAVRIPSDAVLSQLLADSDIKSVIPDRPVHAMPKPSNPGKGGKDKGGNSGQVTPEGVKRIGAAPGVLPVTGTGVGVAIIDTGLNLAHSDLSISPTCFTAFNDCEDGDGHGTHVGGTVAALDNEQDVVGVAPGATLYAVKVLDNNGFGSDSTVMAGLDWIAQNADSVNPPIEVANLSLGREGSLADNPAYRESVRVLTEDLGITVVVAAGNDEGLEVEDNVPATYPEVMAVASSNAKDGTNRCRNYSGNISADTASFFSTDGAFDDNSGIGVTISAPGATQENIKRNCFIQPEGILSLNAGGGTTQLYGTSMAAPHVTGVVALLIDSLGGVLDPEMFRDMIRTSATGIGIAPLDSPTSSYTFDGEREGILSACGVLGVACP